MIGFAATQDPAKKLKAEQKLQAKQSQELLNQRLGQFHAVQQYKNQLEDHFKANPDMVEGLRDTYLSNLNQAENTAWNNVKKETENLVNLNDPTAIQNQLMFNLLGDSEARGLVAKLQAENKLMQNGRMRQFNFNDVNLINAGSHEYWGAQVKDKQKALNEVIRNEWVATQSASESEKNLKKKTDAFEEKYGGTIKSSEKIQKAEDKLIHANATFANKDKQAKKAKKELQKAENELKGTEEIFNDIGPIWQGGK